MTSSVLKSSISTVTADTINRRFMDRDSTGAYWSLDWTPPAVGSFNYLYLKRAAVLGYGDSNAASISMNGSTYSTRQFKLYIDPNDNAHVVYLNSANGNLYYVKAAINASAGTATFETPYLLASRTTYGPSFYAITCIATREATGAFVHIVWSAQGTYDSSNTQTTWYMRLWSPDSGTVQTDDGPTIIGASTGYSSAASRYPEITFAHDSSKASSSKDVYAAWRSSANAIVVRRADGSNNWTWDTPVETTLPYSNSGVFAFEYFSLTDKLYVATEGIDSYTRIYSKSANTTSTLSIVRSDATSLEPVLTASNTSLLYGRVTGTSKLDVVIDVWREPDLAWDGDVTVATYTEQVERLGGGNVWDSSSEDPYVIAIGTDPNTFYSAYYWAYDSNFVYDPPQQSATISATPGVANLIALAPNITVPYTLAAVTAGMSLHGKASVITAAVGLYSPASIITMYSKASNPTGAATVYAAGSHQDAVLLQHGGTITIYWNGLFAATAGLSLTATVPLLHVYQAGTRPTYTQAQLRARYLDPSTIITRRVEILYNNETIWDSGRQQDARLISGGVSVDYDRDERRSLDITLANFDGKLAHRPDAFWYDKLIRVYRGIEFWDEWGRNSHETAIGTFMIDKLNYPRFPNIVKVTARDLTKRAMLTKFSQAASFPNTHEPEAMIAALASSSGIEQSVIPITGETLGTTYTFERGKSYWEGMKEVALAFGYELFLDAWGRLVMRKYLDPTTSPISHSFRTGKTLGNLVDWEVSANDTRIYNHVSVIGTANDETPVWAEAFNTNPTSPTRAELIGNRTYLIESAMVTTFTQAQDLANTYLSIYGLEEYEINMQSIVFPWLDVGEIVEFVDENDTDANEPDRFLLTSLSIPLGLEPMQATGKRVISVS